jgi:hypothetical protein
MEKINFAGVEKVKEIDEPIEGSVNVDFLMNRLDENNLIEFKESDTGIAAHAKRTMLDYPALALRFYRIKKDPFLRDKGLLTGGLYKGGGSAFEMHLKERLFRPGFENECKEVFDHEWGHALFQHIQDATRFLKSNNIELPQSLQNMNGFIASLADPGFRNMLKSPKRFLNEYISFHAETEKPDKRFSALEEKMSELFLLSRSDSQKEIVLKFREVFSKEALSEDWSENIDDPIIMKKWNSIFRPDRIYGYRLADSQNPGKRQN